MKKFVLTGLIAAGFTASALAADVGVSIHIAQPSVYGRIDLGNLPQPQFLYQRPVIITPAPVVLEQQPIYLYVPVAQARNRGRYCGRYDTCGQPVYFVQEGWYRNVYVPAQRRRSHEHDDDNDHQGQHEHEHEHGDHGEHDD